MEITENRKRFWVPVLTSISVILIFIAFSDVSARPFRLGKIPDKGSKFGCGTCHEYCLFGAISIENGRAHHSKACRGCGRCVTHCPEKAIDMSLDNPEFKEEIVRRISAYVDVG